MTRRSIAYKILDDRSFAVRMRIKTGNGDSLPCIENVHQFLREAGSYAIHPATPGIYIYADSPKMIIACVEKFDLTLWSFPKRTT